MKVRITNIQRFSLQDGPGIRTTIFLKGCSLKCPWCSNPENISYEIEEYEIDGEKGIYGKDIELDELNDEIKKDDAYYKIDNGGVTFSGGEVLLQIEKLEPLLKKLKRENINICMETCLVSPLDNLKVALKYVDEFYVDIKLLDKVLFAEVLKGNYDLFINNIKYLFDNKYDKKITYRMPICKEYTLEKNNIEKLEEFLKKYSVKNIEVFTIHRLGEKKYKSLGKTMPNFDKISKKEIDKLYDLLIKYCDKVIINNL